LLELLFQHRRDHLAADLLQRLPLHRSEMAQVSPEGHLQNLRVPVLLLHGAGDNVIPPTETEWLATQVPRHLLRKVLISPLLTHVELDRQTSWRDKLALLEFMTAMLGEVDGLKN
jgi:pimeloyl-ACP methyl ester carboxylesterase